jgi:hypothetical protein
MTTTTARTAVLSRLERAPARLTAEARRVAAAEAASGTPAGEWTPAQVLAHLVAVEQQVWEARLDMLAGDGEPEWVWTEPGPLSDPRAATVDGAAALFEAARADTLARLASLDEAGWARSGVHATYGRLDVAGLMAVAADHDDEHLAALVGRPAQERPIELRGAATEETR